MTTSLIILAVAVVLGGMILLNKKRELSTGEPILQIGTDRSDTVLSDLSDKIEFAIARTDLESIKKIVKKYVLYAESGVLKGFHIIGQRFETVGHMVTGKHIPKNRGSVSFFLKNIEEHKSQGKGGLIK